MSECKCRKGAWHPDCPVHGKAKEGEAPVYFEGEMREAKVFPYALVKGQIARIYARERTK